MWLGNDLYIPCDRIQHAVFRAHNIRNIRACQLLHLSHQTEP